MFAQPRLAIGNTRRLHVPLRRGCPATQDVPSKDRVEGRSPLLAILCASRGRPRRDCLVEGRTSSAYSGTYSMVVIDAAAELL
jgi:hypothetical protein